MNYNGQRTTTLDQRIQRCLSWYAWNSYGCLGEVDDIYPGYTGDKDTHDDPTAYTLEVTRHMYSPLTQKSHAYIEVFRISAEQIELIDDERGLTLDHGIAKDNNERIEPAYIQLLPYGEDGYDRQGLTRYDDDGDPMPATSADREFHKQWY